MFRAFAAISTIALGALAFAAGARAAPVFPPGLRIGLEPAAGLTVSHHFPGFEDAAHHVAVTIFDLPAAAYDKLMRSATAANQQGLREVKRQDFAFTGGIGVLVSGVGQDHGTPVHRWFLVASAAAIAVPNLATLIRVEVPDAARGIYTDAVVRKMLASVSFRRVPVQELLGRLPFKLTAMAGFRVIKVLPDGVLVTAGPGEDLSKQPYAIISIGRGAPDRPDDRARFARDLLTRSPLRDLKLTSAAAFRIGGRPGLEIRADATGLSGEPIALVQWLRFTGIGSSSFLRMIAIAPKADFAGVFERFRTLRDGVEFK